MQEFDVNCRDCALLVIWRPGYAGTWSAESFKILLVLGDGFEIADSLFAILLPEHLLVLPKSRGIQISAWLIHFKFALILDGSELLLWDMSVSNSLWSQLPWLLLESVIDVVIYHVFPYRSLVCVWTFCFIEFRFSSLSATAVAPQARRQAISSSRYHGLEGVLRAGAGYSVQSACGRWFTRSSMISFLAAYSAQVSAAGPFSWLQTPYKCPWSFRTWPRIAVSRWEQTACERLGQWLPESSWPYASVLARSPAVVDRSIVVKRCLILFLGLLDGQLHL